MNKVCPEICAFSLVFLAKNETFNFQNSIVVEIGEQDGVSLTIQPEATSLVEKDGLLIAKVTAISNLADVTRHERDRRVFDLLQRVSL